MRMKKGFTLIELLVTIALIGIVATGILTLLNPGAHIKKANDARRKADLQQIRAALELFRSDNGSYPVTNWVNSSAGESWIPGLNPNYAKSLPKDPKNTGGAPYSGGYTYAYESVTDCGIAAGTSYILTTRLENTSDSEINNNIQYGTCSWPQAAGYTGLYTVGSP